MKKELSQSLQSLFIGFSAHSKLRCMFMFARTIGRTYAYFVLSKITQTVALTPTSGFVWEMKVTCDMKSQQK
jgi:hypothetical protein